nr:AP-3 complex subunit beta-A [Tanacetum cinerariifolium]
MFTQFGTTAENFSKASNIMFRIGTDAHLYDDPDDVSISPLLDSKFDSEKCEALKRLLALIAQGLDVSNYFPQVVKNVASPSLEAGNDYIQTKLEMNTTRIKKWVSKREHIRNERPGGPESIVRKCARDPSVYVRKCAANALPKLHDLRLEENDTAIIEIIGILLNDNSPGVVGAAAAAFASICPNNLPLIGRNCRRLCEILPDVEEWGQIILIGILLRYVIARYGLGKESIMASVCPENINDEKRDSNSSDSDSNFLEIKRTYEMNSGIQEPELLTMVSRSYLAGPDKYVSRSGTADIRSSDYDSSQFTSSKSDDDVKILLQCTSPLLWSRNSAVVLAAAGVHWIMGPMEDIAKIVKPLLFLLRSSNAAKYVADSYEVDNSDVESGSLNEEGSYDSEESVTDSTGTDYTNGSAASEAENNTDPLINLSDVGKSQKDVKATEKNEFGELMSKGALESCEPLSKLYLSDEDSAVSSESSDQSSPPDESSLQSQKDAPILAPMEEIATLEPGQTTKTVIHVRHGCKRAGFLYEPGRLFNFY